MTCISGFLRKNKHLKLNQLSTHCHYCARKTPLKAYPYGTETTTETLIQVRGIKKPVKLHLVCSDKWFAWETEVKKFIL